MTIQQGGTMATAHAGYWPGSILLCGVMDGNERRSITDATLVRRILPRPSFMLAILVNLLVIVLVIVLLAYSWP